MAEGLNRVMLMGNLGADPELRYTQSGRAVLNMRLATTESYVDRDGQRKDRTEWHNVAIWGKRAEALGKFLAKGSSIFVEGSIRYSSYEGQDGQKRYKTEINARNIILTGRRGDGGGNRDFGGSDYNRSAQTSGGGSNYGGGGSSYDGGGGSNYGGGGGGSNYGGGGGGSNYGGGGGGSSYGGGGGQQPQAAQGGFGGADDDDDDIPF